MNEFQENKKALVATLMMMKGHEPVEFRGRRMPASAAMKLLLNEDATEFVNQTSAPSTASIVPTDEALAGLSAADRAALEAGAGIPGLTKPVTPTIRARQVENSGVIQTTFHFDPETGKVVPGSGRATHQEEQPSAGPTVRTDSGAPTRTTYRAPEQTQRNPWARFDENN